MKLYEKAQYGAFSSVVRQMPGLNSQRWGTARTVPNWLLFVLFYVILFSNLMHNFFIKSIVSLYMFRAILRSSSGGLNCIYTASGS